MRCRFCQAEIEQNALFCPQCGKKIGSGFVVNRKWIAIALLLLLVCGSVFYCSRPRIDGEKAEEFTMSFFTYYLENYPNFLNVCDEVAEEYLTEKFSKDYLYYIKEMNHLDLIMVGQPHRENQRCNMSVSGAEYIGNNKVQVNFTSLEDGHEFCWYATIKMVGSEYRIEYVSVNEN